ncbi:MAG: DHA2 family efflux MFS transporter permease subunit, partial [Acidimicrobiales bacterium]
YFLAVAVMIPVAGFLGDKFGTKRIFLVALSGFVAASALSGTAQSLQQLVAFCMIQGLFAGLITPIGSAMLFRAFPLPERAKASAAVISVAVIAPAVGPTLGGLLIETLSWRWIFYINIPIGGLGLVVAALWLHEEVVGASGRIDWVGLIMSGGGLGLVLFGVSEGPNRGWGSPLVLASLVVGIVAIVVLIVVETRIENPALALRLFRDRLFRSANLVSAPLYMGFFGGIFLLPIFLQTVGGHPPLTTGLTVSAQALGVMLTSQLAGRRLYNTVGPRRLLLVGSLAAMVAGLWFVTIDETTALPAIAVATFTRGLAMGLVFIPIQTATYATIPLRDMGRATSLFNMQRQAAVATGIALVATVLSSSVSSLANPAEGGAPTADRVNAFQSAFLVSALAFGVAAALSLLVHDEDAQATMRT